MRPSLSYCGPFFTRSIQSILREVVRMAAILFKPFEPPYISQNSSTCVFSDAKVDSFLSVIALPSGGPHGISLQTQGLTYTGRISSMIVVFKSCRMDDSERLQP